MTTQGNQLKKGTYAHWKPTDIKGVSIDVSAKPYPRPTIASTEDNGFTDRNESTIAFDDGTRTFTITPVDEAFYFWCHGDMYAILTPESITITDTEGLHVIHYDEGGILVAELLATADLFDIIVRNAIVAIVYWDATNGKAILLSDERHGRMDGQAHIHFHQSFGTQWVAGLSLSGITANGVGNSDTHCQFTVDEGSIRDEDLWHIITDGSPQELSPAEIPMFYRSGASGDWRRVDATVYPVVNTGTGRLAWNEDTGATWQLTEITNTKFVLTHYLVTSDVNHPIIGIVGQAQYDTKSLAQAGAPTELRGLQLGVLSTLAPEFVPIATVIWKTSDSMTNGAKAAIQSTDEGEDYVDLRQP